MIRTLAITSIPDWYRKLAIAPIIIRYIEIVGGGDHDQCKWFHVVVCAKGMKKRGNEF